MSIEMTKNSTEQSYNTMMKSDEIFNELFNTFLGEESIVSTLVASNLNKLLTLQEINSSM